MEIKNKQQKELRQRDREERKRGIKDLGDRRDKRKL